MTTHSLRRQARAARDESPAAFDRRCIPAGGVAPSSNTASILGRRALPSGRIARLGATWDFHHGLLVPVAGLLGLVFALVGTFGAPALTANTQDEKILYLTAVDKDGKAVTDLKLGDVMIREDNQDREVVGVKKSTQPVAIVILADTTKNGGGSGLKQTSDKSTATAELIRDIRVSVGSFMKQIAAGSPESQMELMEFGQAAIVVTKMTSNMTDLEKGVTRLFPKPEAGSVLLEAIADASKDLTKTEIRRRAIVSLNIEPGDENSRTNVRQLHEELSKSRAGLWAVSLQSGQNKNQLRVLVLDTLTGNTGGRREYIQSPSGLELVMGQFADNLLNQYEVTYKRPAGAKAQGVLVGVARDNLKLFASRIPPQ